MKVRSEKTHHLTMSTPELYAVYSALLTAKAATREKSDRMSASQARHNLEALMGEYSELAQQLSFVNDEELSIFTQGSHHDHS